MMYSAAEILGISKSKVDSFLKEKVDGENFTKFIDKDSSNGPTLSWVEIGVSYLANVEIKTGLTNGDKVYVLPSKGLVDYQNKFKERVKNSFG